MGHDLLSQVRHHCNTFTKVHVNIWLKHLASSEVSVRREACLAFPFPSSTDYSGSLVTSVGRKRNYTNHLNTRYLLIKHTQTIYPKLTHLSSVCTYLINQWTDNCLNISFLLQTVDTFFISQYVLLSVASVGFLVALFGLLPLHFLEAVYAKPLNTLELSGQAKLAC